MSNIYRLALQVQDASNINGVVNSLAKEVLPAIREEAAYKAQGMPAMANNPALILFLDKLVSMTNVGWIHDVDSRISQAYTDCHTLAEGLEAVAAASLPGGPLS
jgi:hypothetical protein